MTTLRRIKYGIFGAAIAGALSFGGAQLAATTTAGPCEDVPCRSGPNEQACDACCQALVGGPLSDGYCGPDGECLCAF